MTGRAEERPAPSGEAPSAGSRDLALVGLPAVLLAVLWVFWPALSGELVYDDLRMVAQNPLLADPGRLGELLTQPLWAPFSTGGQEVGYWRPLTSLALVAGQALGNGAPAAFHVVSLALHLAAAVAAHLLATRLSGSRWVGLATALLFAVHPVQVESVAWITAMNEPLYGGLAFLSLYAFLRWRERGSHGLPVAAALLLGAALGAKEAALAIPLLAAVLDLGRRRLPGEPTGLLGGLARAPARAYLPLAAVVALWVLARMLVFRSPLAGFEPSTDFRVGLTRLLFLRVEILGGAVELLAWPRDLRVFRPFRPDLPPLDPALLRASIGCLVLAGGIVLCALRRARTSLAALLFVPVALFPTWFAVGSIGRFPLADRFLYLAVFGATLFLAHVLLRTLPRLAAVACLLVLAAAGGHLARERTAVWSDEEALFRAAAAETPRSPYVMWGLGRVLLERHRRTETPHYLRDAFRAYENAQQLLQESKLPQTDVFVTSRDFLQVNLGLGWCYLFDDEQQGYGGYSTPIAMWEELLRKIDETLAEREQAAELGLPVDPEHLDVEQVHTAIGVGYTLAGKPHEAEAALRAALEVNPRYPEAYQNLGRLQARRGDWEQAAASFERALERRPGNYEDTLLLAQALHSGGERARAGELARELVERDPRPEPFFILATNRLADGDAPGALREIDRALQADPQNGFAWYLKARASRTSGTMQETLLAFRKAVELSPTNFEAHFEFGSFLLATGAADAAVPLLVRAYALVPDAALAERMRTLLADLPHTAPGPLFELAAIDQRRGQLDAADAWLDAVLTMDPDHGEAHFLRARILEARDEPERALEAMRRAVVLLPDSFVVQSELGFLLADRGHAVEALGHLERSLELSPPREWEPGAARAALEAVRDRLSALRD